MKKIFITFLLFLLRKIDGEYIPLCVAPVNIPVHERKIQILKSSQIIDPYEMDIIGMDGSKFHFGRLIGDELIRIGAVSFTKEKVKDETKGPWKNQYGFLFKVTAQLDFVLPITNPTDDQDA